LDECGTIEIFKAGLKNGLIKAIIGSPHFNPLQPWDTFDCWVREAYTQHLKWKMGLQYSAKSPKQVKQALYYTLKKKGNNQHTTSQGGNAMDIDTTCMSNLTEAQKANLLKENKCFYCQKTGHHTNIYYKKKHNKGETTTTSQVNIVDTSDGQTEAAKTVNGIVRKMTDEEKLKLVEDLLLKDFLQGTD
jgi:DNA-directed RNA polymerase subunit M/transcription elongation factor TFIIS